MLIQTYNIRVTSYKIDTGSSTKITCKAMAHFTIYPSQEILTKIPDLNREILLELDDKSLGGMCITCKEAHDVCKDDLFWRERIIRMFYIDLTKYKDKGSSYREIYIFFSKINTEDIHTQMQSAMMSGCLPILKYLIEKQRENVALITYEDKLNLITVALKSNFLNIIIYIIETFLKLDFNDYATRIALNTNIKVFKCLVDKGIIGSDNFVDFLHVAVSENNMEIVTYIVAHFRPNSEQINYVIYVATLTTNLSMLEYLVKIGGKVNDYLYVATQTGYMKGITYLIEQAGADDFDTALVLSAHTRLDIVKYLISKGANIHAYDDKALRNAEAAGNTDIIEYLRGLE